MQSLNIHENCLSYRLHKPDTPYAFRMEKKRKMKIFIKCAQNERCTSSICEEPLCKVLIKKNESFWSYRLHKVGTVKCCDQTDRRTDGVDPLLDLLSLYIATQVKIQ